MPSNRYAHWEAPESPVFAGRVVAAFCRVAGATELFDRFGTRPQELEALTGEIERAWGEPWFYDDIRRYWDGARSRGTTALPAFYEVLSELRERRIGRNMMPPVFGTLPPIPPTSSLPSQSSLDGSSHALPEPG